MRMTIDNPTTWQDAIDHVWRSGMDPDHFHVVDEGGDVRHYRITLNGEIKDERGRVQNPAHQIPFASSVSVDDAEEFETE